MTLESWKDKVYANLVNLRLKKEKLQAKTVYGLLADNILLKNVQHLFEGE